MSSAPRRPAELRGRIFRGSTARRRGLLTKADLRSKAWQHLFRDVYADSRLRVDHLLRARTACRYLIAPDAVVAGRSAAVAYGVDLLHGAQPVEVLTPGRMDSVHGLVVHRGALEPGDTVHLPGGLRLTSAARTCWDLCAWLDIVDAVAYLDVFLARRLVLPEELIALFEDRRRRRGSARFLRALRLVDPLSESPQESRLRVRLTLAGLPRPVCQFELIRDGRFIARVDLAWPTPRVAVEYDGRWHADPAQLDRDRARLNRILGEDWIVLHVTARRLREDFDGFVAEVRAALRSRR